MIDIAYNNVFFSIDIYSLMCLKTWGRCENEAGHKLIRIWPNMKASPINEIDLENVKKFDDNGL